MNASPLRASARRLLPGLTLAVVFACGAPDTASAPAQVDPDQAPALDAGTATEDAGAATEDAGLETPAVPGAAEACGCADYKAPATVGFMSLALKETSGLAVSRNNPGVIYAHNDSGGTARVFAINSKGVALGELVFGGATAVDWEDIAVGPCGGTASSSCVWVGDVGNNNENRNDLALYAIDEPALDGKPFAPQTIAARKYPFSYPDGKWNCEALLVHPTTGEIYVVTKKSSIEAGVYKFPANLVPGTPVVVEKVGTAKDTMGSLVTGGDVSPCGDRLVLRTYKMLLEYTLPPGGSVAGALSSTPRSLPVASEGQGEAVAYWLKGRGYLTAGEGTLVPLSYSGCK